jgi:hypothetical protein
MTHGTCMLTLTCTLPPAPLSLCYFANFTSPFSFALPPWRRGCLRLLCDQRYTRPCPVLLQPRPVPIACPQRLPSSSLATLLPTVPDAPPAAGEISTRRSPPGPSGPSSSPVALPRRCLAQLPIAESLAASASPWRSAQLPAYVAPGRPCLGAVLAPARQAHRWRTDLSSRIARES